MKLSVVLVAVSFSACVSAVAKKYVVGFDKMPALAPPLLGNLKNPVVPNPTNSLLYSNSWSVVLLGGQLLPLLKPFSIYNVIASPPLNMSTPGPSISKAAGIQSFSVDYLYFACATAVAGQTVPVPCNVLFTGKANSASTPDKSNVATFNGGNSMVRVPLGFTGLSSLSVMVQNAGADLLLQSQVSVLIDSISYTTYT